MSALENKELLLSVVTKFAAMQLKKSGELMPFGATLNATRKVELLIPKSIKQNVTPDELSTYWARELRTAAEKSDSPTVCSCCAGLFRQESGSLSPSLFIHIEHADAYSEDVLYPYRKETDGNIAFGERESESVAHQVFPIN
jgi:hypothetical protein